MTVIALKQRYAGHSKRAGLIAAAQSYMGRIVVTVDEDVDPSNLADVMWAITTRCEPSEQVDIVKSAWSSGLDPRITPEAAQPRRNLALQADRGCVQAVRLEGPLRVPPRSAPTRRAPSAKVVPLSLRLQRGAACGAGGVMAWERGRGEGARGRGGR